MQNIFNHINILTVGTHDGVFHADDVFAVAALDLKFGGVEIIRSRNPKELADADLLVDVGGAYKPMQLIFDHHQAGGAGARRNGVKYAGFGLIWRHFGEPICGSKLVATRVDRALVQVIDAVDNGQNGFSRELSLAVNSMCPQWHEGGNFNTYMRAFERAVKWAKTVLQLAIELAKINRLDTETIACIGTNDPFVAERKDVRQLAEAKSAEIVAGGIEHANGQILELSEYCLWQPAVVETRPEAKLVVFQDISGSWRVQVVPVSSTPGSFDSRCSLPTAWWGAARPVLVELTDVSDVIFCHPNGFIGGAQTREGVMRLAERAIAEHHIQGSNPGMSSVKR